MENFSLKGLVGVVTGGASGLGQAVVKSLIKQQCKVAFLDINRLAAEELMKNLSEITSSSQFLFIEADISKEDCIKQAITEIIAKFECIHIVVNCAAIAKTKAIEETDSSMLQEIFSTNVYGPFWMTKYAVPYMKKQAFINDKKQRGVIIHVSSEQATEGAAGRILYCATKGALNSMTLPMAREFGPWGIRVVTVAPGMFLTPLVQKHHDEQWIQDYSKQFALGRAGLPEEFGETIIGICMSTFMTGCVVRVDGGVRTGNVFSADFMKEPSWE